MGADYGGEGGERKKGKDKLVQLVMGEDKQDTDYMIEYSMSKTLCHDDSGCLCCNSYDIITYPFTL
jgi:hypothetical protein